MKYEDYHYPRTGRLSEKRANHLARIIAAEWLRIQRELPVERRYKLSIASANWGAQVLRVPYEYFKLEHWQRIRNLAVKHALTTLRLNLPENADVRAHFRGRHSSDPTEPRS